MSKTDDQFAITVNGTKGVIRDKCQAHMKLDDGRFFIPVDQDIELLRASLQSMQARIDELMLEYCPDEITKEQVAEYERNQRQKPCCCISRKFTHMDRIAPGEYIHCRICGGNMRLVP